MNVASSLNDPVFHINQVKWHQNKHNIQDIQEYVMELMCVYRYSLNLSVTFEIKHLNSDPQTFAELLSVLRNLFFFFIAETPPNHLKNNIYTKWQMKVPSECL